MEAHVLTNSMNDYTVSELNYLRTTIENMTKPNQLGILRIMHKYNNVKLNENKYGVHVNLSGMDNDVLSEMFNYVKYVNSQESNLNIAEQQMKDYKNTFFSTDETTTNKDIKDIGTIIM